MQRPPFWQLYPASRQFRAFIINKENDVYKRFIVKIILSLDFAVFVFTSFTSLTRIHGRTNASKSIGTILIIYASATNAWIPHRANFGRATIWARPARGTLTLVAALIGQLNAKTTVLTRILRTKVNGYFTISSSGRAWTLTLVARATCCCDARATAFAWISGTTVDDLTTCWSL